MKPAMIVDLDLRACGLAWQRRLDRPRGWFHAKFALVIVLSGLHGYSGAMRKDFAADRNRPGRVLPDDQRGPDRC